MFGELLWWIKEGSDENDKQYLLRGLRARAKLFVRYSPERFLFWAGTHPDITLEYDEPTGYLMAACESTFGLAQGKAYSTLSVVDYTVRPHGLDLQSGHQTRDCGFAVLWNQARKLGDIEAQQVLAAVRAWHVTPMIKLAPWLATRDEDVDGDTIGALIHDSPDPIAEIYAYLVPLKLTREQFETRISPLEGRKMALNLADRRSLWSRLRRSNMI